MSVEKGTHWTRAERTREAEEERQDSAAEGAGNVFDSQAEGGSTKSAADAGSAGTERCEIVTERHYDVSGVNKW